MASSAMTIPSATGIDASRRQSSGVLRRHCYHLAAVVIPAGRAKVMRPLHLAAIRALGIGRGLERMMRAAHVAARLGGLFLRNGHGEDSHWRGGPAGADRESVV